MFVADLHNDILQREIGSDYDGLDFLPKELIDCKDHIKIAEKPDERDYFLKNIEKLWA